MILTEPSPHEIIYLDPPWYRTPCGTARTPYKTMTWEALHAFDLGVCEVLSTWCKRFGLYEAGVAYIWIKTTQTGVPIGASGPRPKLVKQLGEFVIALTTSKRGRVFPLLTEAQPQWVFAPKPVRGSHSRKPAVVRDNIVELFGEDRSRVELFAREPTPGWNAWGDELAA